MKCLPREEWRRLGIILRAKRKSLVRYDLNQTKENKERLQYFADGYYELLGKLFQEYRPVITND